MSLVEYVLATDRTQAVATLETDWHWEPVNRNEGMWFRDSNVPVRVVYRGDQLRGRRHGAVLHLAWGYWIHQDIKEVEDMIDKGRFVIGRLANR